MKTKLILDVNKTQHAQLNSIVTGRVGDKASNTVDVYIVDGFIPYNLTGSDVYFECAKPDNTSVRDKNGITMIDAAKGHFEYTFPTQTFSSLGKSKQAYFTVEKNSTVKATTQDFIIVSLPDALTNRIPSKTYISQLDELIKQLEQMQLDVLNSEAYREAHDAKEFAEQANELSISIQKQLDTIVINGDSSVEAAQARERLNGNVFPVLKDRIDYDSNRVDIFSTSNGVTVELFPVQVPESDDSGRFRRTIESFNGGIGTINLNPKRYKISSQLDIPDGFCFSGLGYVPRGSNKLGTIIERTANVVAFNIQGTSVISGVNKGGVKFNNIKFHGGDFVEDFMRITACTGFVFDECLFYAMGGRQIKATEFMDSRFVNCLFEWGGNASGTLPAIELISGGEYEFTNQIHFVGCRMESYRGTMLKTTGDNTNEIFFTNCKFESLQSNVSHLVFENTNVISFDVVNICSRGSVGSVLPSQVSFSNCSGITGVLLLEHTGVIDTNAAKIDRFVNVQSSSNIDIYVHVYLNGNKGLSPSVVMVDQLSDEPSISVRGSIKDYNGTRELCNYSQKIRSSSIRTMNPYLRFKKSDINGEYWDIGRVIADGIKSKFRLIHGSNESGERLVFDINANDDMTFYRDVFMNGRAFHPSQLSTSPFGREGSLYVDTTNSIACHRFQLGGDWRRIGYSNSKPTSGVWKVADKIYNTNPVPGGYEGWICTSTAPLIFKEFGKIEL
ncbi:MULTISPECIES: BppU family phage baseplate upper protein [unclassified Bacillus cereus group]|uniref:BppU family phage baseplate upper protein n=1 Tax=unclassified Bacillus cereus group TaxID=2750818 RepID=UPI003391DEA6